MIEPISSLKKEELKAFQKISLLEVPNVDIKELNDLLVNGYENIQYFTYKNEMYAYDIFYRVFSSENKYLAINQNWAFIKERLKQLNYKYPHEIVYDTVINISMSNSILVKESFDFYTNILSTVKYYSNVLKSNILVRTDDFNGNKFFLNKR